MGCLFTILFLIGVVWGNWLLTILPVVAYLIYFRIKVYPTINKMQRVNPKMIQFIGVFNKNLPKQWLIRAYINEPDSVYRFLMHYLDHLSRSDGPYVSTWLSDWLSQNDNNLYDMWCRATKEYGELQRKEKLSTLYQKDYFRVENVWWLAVLREFVY